MMPEAINTITDPAHVSRLLSMFHVHQYNKKNNLSASIGTDPTARYYVMDGKVYAHNILAHTIEVYDSHEFHNAIRRNLLPGFVPEPERLDAKLQETFINIRSIFKVLTAQGAFDNAACDLHPDFINAMCDRVDALANGDNNMLDKRIRDADPNIDDRIDDERAHDRYAEREGNHSHRHAEDSLNERMEIGY